MKKRRLVFPTIVIVIASFSDVSAQEISGDKTAAFVEKVGSQAAKQYLNSSDLKVAKSTLPFDQQNAFLEAKLAEYAQTMRVYYEAKNTGEWARIGIAGAFGLAGLQGGSSGHLATLYSATIGAYMDAGNDAIGKLAEIKAQQFWAKNKADILAASGVASYEDIQQDPSKLRLPTALIEDLRSRAKTTNDKSLEEAAHALLAEVSSRTDEALLTSSLEANQKLDDIDDELADLVEAVDTNHDEIVARLDEYDTTLKMVSNKVTKVSEKMAQIGADLHNQGRNQAFIADFVLREMGPRQKADALKAGFMAERFTCPPKSTECGAQKYKEELISSFEAQADLQDGLVKASKVAGGLNNVAKIASDLGIESPELQTAALIGNTALTAVTAYFSGDPLSAVSAITSLFGKRKDPNSQMMGYLKQQFAQVNAKLDAIIENQQLLLEAVVKLSDQMQQRFDALDTRLARLELESSRMSEGVRALIWKPWAACYSVYSTAIEPNANGTIRFADSKSGRFTSFSAVANTFALRDENFVKCLSTIQSDMDSLSATSWFGNFIDAQWILDENIALDFQLGPAGPIGDQLCKSISKMYLAKAALSHQIIWPREVSRVRQECRFLLPPSRM